MSRFMLDCAVLRPVDDQATQWWTAATRRAWADPGAGYHEGKVSLALLEQSAATFARLVGGRAAWFAADPEAAVRSALTGLAEDPAVASLVTSAADALPVQRATAAYAEERHLEHTVVDVDGSGRIDPLALARVTTPAVLVTHVGNQEIGVVQTDLAPWAAATGSAVVLHAGCAFGWIPLPTAWDRLILDPRAWGSVPGAAVVVSPGAAGRAVTDNVPAAVTAALTAEHWLSASGPASERARRQSARIRARVVAEIADVQVRGGGPDDLPHILSISVLYVDAEAVQTRLDTLGYAVGSGSACASRSGQPSHVLAAIGGLTSGNVRIGLPPGLDDEVADRFVDALVDVVHEVRGQMGTRGL